MAFSYPYVLLILSEVVASLIVIASKPLINSSSQGAIKIYNITKEYEGSKNTKNYSCDEVKLNKHPTILTKLWNKPGAVFSRKLLESFNHTNEISSFSPLRIYCTAKYPIRISGCPTVEEAFPTTYDTTGDKTIQRFEKSFTATLDLSIDSNLGVYVVRCVPKNCDLQTKQSELIVNMTSKCLTVFPTTILSEKSAEENEGISWTKMALLSIIFGPPTMIITICVVSLFLVNHIEERRKSLAGPGLRIPHEFPLEEMQNTEEP